MKPIKLTPELQSQAKTNFEDYLRGLKMHDGKISYSQTFSYKDSEKVYLSFSYKAFAKMLTLITKYSTEVAWHGSGEKLSDSQYYIDDVFVYPQKVTGAHVDMDLGKYMKWQYEHASDPRFKRICFQGHSHVLMSPSPSSVDLTHQAEILEDLGDSGFYVFIIMNKRMEYEIRIFDLDSNVMYESSDVVMDVYDEDDSLMEFMKESESLASSFYQKSKPDAERKPKDHIKEEYDDEDYDEDEEAINRLYNELYGRYDKESEGLYGSY